MKWTLVFSLWYCSANARWMNRNETGAVAEYYLVDYKVEKDGGSTQTVDYSVLVQAEDGKTTASSFAIDYNSATDKVEILEAYTLNGTTKVPVEAFMIEDRDRGTSNDYDAMKSRSVAFPQVQIGSRIRIRYKVQTEKPAIKGRWNTQINLGPGMLIDKVRVTVNSALPIYYKVYGQESYANVTQKNKSHLTVKNRSKIPGWIHAEKDPYFHPDRYARIYISTEDNWLEYFAPLQMDVDQVLANPLPQALESWVQSAKKLETPNAQILLLMEKMSLNFRYFGDWRRHDGGVVPRSLAEIDKSRFGDCKDLSALLVSLLRRLGIDASIALVRRGDNAWGIEPDYVLPALTYFNHAIVRARIKGETFWIDPTNSVSSIDPYSDIAGRPAWVLQQKNPGFERIPAVTSASFLNDIAYQYEFKGLDKVKVRIDAKLGNLASFSTANQLMMQSKSEVLSSWLERLTEGHEISEYHFVKEPATTRLLKDMEVKLDYVTDRVTYAAGKDAFFVILDGILDGAFYETDERQSDMELGDSPYGFNAVRRLKNVELKQKAPEPCRIESKWMNLARNIKVEGADVVISQNMELKVPYVLRSEYSSKEFKELQKATRECFYRSGVLVSMHK